MELLFDKNKNLFQDQLSMGIKLSSGIDEKLFLEIAQNTTLKELELPIVIAEGGITASGPVKEFRFKEVPNVSISGNAGANLRIGIYDKAEDVIKDLIHKDKLGLDLPDLDDKSVYGVFSYGYFINGDVEGEWPLGSVQLSASVDGNEEKRAAVIVTLKKTIGIKKAIVGIISELQSPKQVQNAKDLAPGTYLVMQREGTLNTNFGAQVGFDFDWTFESQNPNFNGTLGLQTRLGGLMQVGLNIAGEFTLIVSRPHKGQVIHLHLNKRRLNGWNFAAGLNASVQGDLNEFDDFSVNDIIKATIGIHHAQILEDIRQWVDPDVAEKKLHGLTNQLLKEITGTTTFKKANQTLIALFDKWDAVGNEGGGAILKLIEDNASVDLSKVQEDFKKLSTADVADFLEEKLEKTGFQDTKFGQILGSIVPFDDLFEIVAEQELVNKLQDKSRKLSELLDFQELIKNLHKKISEKLSLDRIRKAAKSGNLEELGDWLKGKLTSLTQNDLADELRLIDAYISNFENNAVQIFEKVKTALQREYGMSLAYTYQKQKEYSALIDAHFNFAQNAQIGDILEEALDGNYSQLMTNTEIKGIHLNNGILTHRIKKQKTLSLLIPGAKRNFSRINQSIAAGTFIDEQDGRLIMYELNASDTIRRNKRLIQLSLTGNYFGKKKGHSFGLEKESLKVSFDFKVQDKKLRRRHLEQIVEPFIKVNLKHSFSETTNLTTDQWINQMDYDIENFNANGKKRFGKTLITMTHKIPPQIANAWMGAPSNKKDKKYKEVSSAIQKSMRGLVQTFAYENEEMFTKNYNREKLQVILLYTSLPVVKDIHYNYNDLIKRPGRVTANLGRNIMILADKLRLDPDPHVRRSADDFDNVQTSIREITNMMVNDSDFIRKLENLVSKEHNIVSKVIKSATKISGLKKTAINHPEIAIKKLSEFGAELTDTINDVNVGFIAIRKDYTRFMGPHLFIAASKALAPGLVDNTTGFLELIVLKESSNFEMESYLDGKKPEIKDIIISQLIVDLS
ncbi:hypothetical protein [Algibacter mikhailovii]|uniref:hypothetical protein n=1 Tax=Algibacter mikhailovii TaxID=425498 RepID=UPI002493E752|nr:hypothetical protein [Algibacter mikhailovii]